MKINTTTINKLEMQSEFRVALKDKFPSSKGWKIYNRFSWIPGIHDFVVQRYENNKIERVVFEINLASMITANHMSRYRELTDRLENEHSVVLHKYLVITQDARELLTRTPYDCELLNLDSFFNKSVVESSGLKSTIAA